jgi:hypothetical protein
VLPLPPPPLLLPPPLLPSAFNIDSPSFLLSFL